MCELKRDQTLCATEIESRIHAVDQLQVSSYTIRGVSDTLFSLADESNDYNDALRMLADVTFCQWEAFKAVEIFLESEFSPKLDEESTL